MCTYIYRHPYIYISISQLVWHPVTKNNSSFPFLNKRRREMTPNFIMYTSVYIAAASQFFVFLRCCGLVKIKIYQSYSILWSNTCGEGLSQNLLFLVNITDKPYRLSRCRKLMKLFWHSMNYRNIQGNLKDKKEIIWSETIKYDEFANSCIPIFSSNGILMAW